MGQLLFKSFPVTEIEPDGDDLRVVGKCSDYDVDLDGDVVNPGFMKRAVDEWLRVCPAIRLEHRDYAAGLGLAAWQDDDGATWVKSRIADARSKSLVLSGRLHSYSVGIADAQTRPHPRAPRWEIYGGRLSEVSIVSAPSNQRCGITVCKSVDGVPRFIGKAYGKAPKPGKAAKILKRAAAAERADLAPWLNSADPAIRERAAALLALGRVVRDGKVTKSGKAGKPGLPEDPVAMMFAASPDPWVREVSRGLHP